MGPTVGPEAGGKSGQEAGCRAAGAALAAVDACATFLSLLGSERYTRPSPLMHNATIGQHVRHALDHYAAALRGARGEIIDYDHRERGRAVETDLAAALSELMAIRDGLAGIDAQRSADPVRVRVMVNGSTGEEAELGSTLGREIAFAAHHAVHHHAMISAIAQSMGVRVPEGFAKAPATLHHERGARG